MNHYGSSFGDEGRQTSLPTCMNRMHRNYSWRSRVVSGSDVCNRASVCSVFNRVSSNIAKVDRSGNVVSCGPTAMEAAVMQRGGRVPATVASEGVAAEAEEGCAAVAAAAASHAGGESVQECGGAKASRPCTSLISAVYMNARGMGDAPIPPHQQVGSGKSMSKAEAAAAAAAEIWRKRLLASCGQSMASDTASVASSGMGGGAGSVVSSFSQRFSHLWSASSSYGGNSVTDGQYTYMDEEYLRCLQAHMMWDRDCGIIHLMPIAVVYQEDFG